MKAAVYYETGGPEVFRYEDVPDPIPGPNELLVAVEAVSIEGGDTLNRLGGEIAHTPHVVGYQCAGRVVGLGEGVVGFALGDRVVTVGLDGSHAELRTAGVPFSWKVPDGVETTEAACVPVPFGTAEDCLFEFGRLTAGETALIHAGAGGVGIAAIQMAHRAGARVLATASSDDRLARLTALGLDEGINYARGDFVAEARRLTDGRGVDVVVDSVGSATLQGSIDVPRLPRSVRERGRRGPRAGSAVDISGCAATTRPSRAYFLGAELFVGTRAHAMIERQLRRSPTGSCASSSTGPSRRPMPLRRTPTSRAARRSAASC